MKRRTVIGASAGLLFAAAWHARAQPAGKLYRVGYLSGGSLTASAYVLGPFRQGLREHGWIEGQNIVIDYRFAEGRFERLPALAAELVQLKVDVIVAVPTGPAEAARNATGTIPIVMFGPVDPVASGLVASLARPRGNVTGLTYSPQVEIFSKQLGLLREMVPHVRRMAILANPANMSYTLWKKNAQVSSVESLGVQLRLLEVRSPDEFDGAFAAMAKEGIEAVLQNLIIERRDAAGQVDRLPSLAAELVALRPDLIVASAPQPNRALKGATSTVPIVMVGVADPVQLGLVESLARPGGNITGVATMVPEGFGGKTLQLLGETVPTATRVAVLINPSNEMHRLGARDRLLNATRLGIHLKVLDVRFVQDEVLYVAHPRPVVQALAGQRKPAIYPHALFCGLGGLMSYSLDMADQFRRAATYVDRILRGAKPGELAVEEGSRLELVINMKTAKAFGLTMPRSFLLRADRVIE